VPARLTVADSQNHHYIPQFLLKGWCNQNGKLTVYSRPQGRVVTSERSPRGSGFEPDLYTYEVSGEKRHTIETDFITPGIDTPAALVVQKILSGEFCELTLEERSDVARFALSLRARHPDAVALVKAKGLEAITSALARDPDEYEAVKGSASPPTLTEWARQNAPSLIPNFGMSRSQTDNDDKTVEHIFRMPWWIHDVHHANTDLLLSDRPCLLNGNAVRGRVPDCSPSQPDDAAFHLQ
jgi:hypothetical protein